MRVGRKEFVMLLAVAVGIYVYASRGAQAGDAAMQLQGQIEENLKQQNLQLQLQAKNMEGEIARLKAEVYVENGKLAVDETAARAAGAAETAEHAKPRQSELAMKTQVCGGGRVSGLLPPLIHSLAE